MGLSLRARKIHLVHLVTQEMIKHLLVSLQLSSSPSKTKYPMAYKLSLHIELVLYSAY